GACRGFTRGPDLRVSARQVLFLKGPCRTPLLVERALARVHGALALDQTGGEALEHLHHHLLHRAEVVVHQAMIDAGLFAELSGRDRSVALFDEQTLRRVEKRLDGFPTAPG